MSKFLRTEVFQKHTQRQEKNREIVIFNLLNLYNELLTMLRNTVGYETQNIIDKEGHLIVVERALKVRSTFHNRIQKHMTGKHEYSHGYILQQAVLLLKSVRMHDISDVLGDANMPDDLDFVFTKRSNAVGMYSVILQEDVPELSCSEKYELLFFGGDALKTC